MADDASALPLSAAVARGMTHRFRPRRVVLVIVVWVVFGETLSLKDRPAKFTILRVGGIEGMREGHDGDIKVEEAHWAGKDRKNDDPRVSGVVNRTVGRNGCASGGRAEEVEVCALVRGAVETQEPGSELQGRRDWGDRLHRRLNAGGVR